MTAYQSLEAIRKRVAALGNAMGILHWDMETMMPDGVAPARAEVLAEMSKAAKSLATCKFARDAPALSACERHAY